MLTLVIVLAVVWTLGLLALAGGVFRAPEGTQDEGGFHAERR